MLGVLATARAKLLQAQTILNVLLILRRLIIALFAVTAREHQNRLILGCHNLLRNLNNLSNLNSLRSKLAQAPGEN